MRICQVICIGIAMCLGILARSQTVVVGPVTYLPGQPVQLAGTTITTDGNVVISGGADVAFVATQNILLGPGFEMQPGAIFSASGTTQLPPPSPVTAPVFSPVAGTFASAQSVTIGSTTSGASIAYTTDGSTPTEVGGMITHGTSLANGGTVSISINIVLNAIAYEPGMADSPVESGIYTIGNSPPPQVAGPVFTPPASTYTSAQTVTVTSATFGATIAYTTDGSTPAESGGTVTHGTLLANSGAVSIHATTTLSAIAFESGMTDSRVESGIYTIGNSLSQIAAPVFSPVAGTYTSAQTVTVTSATSGATIAYTTDGSTPTESGGTVTHGTSLANGGAISISVTATLGAIAFKPSMTDSSVGTATYTISAPIPTILPIQGSDGDTAHSEGSDGPMKISWVIKPATSNNYEKTIPSLIKK